MDEGPCAVCRAHGTRGSAWQAYLLQIPFSLDIAQRDLTFLLKAFVERGTRKWAAQTDYEGD